MSKQNDTIIWFHFLHYQAPNGSRYPLGER
jgi:hypothetical protein